MLAARPIAATYTYDYVRDGISRSLSNTGPTGITFANAAPATPLFTISGVSGNWSVDVFGRGVFSFDPASTSSFTVTLND